MKLEAVIGLEIHVQLKTKSKMFCSCSNIGDDNNPNSVICPICMGHPGTLPNLNEGVIEYASKLALALNLKINKENVFERKNYFYPDLPQGYQISQLEKPFSHDGFLIVSLDNKKTKVRIEKLHIENDSAKNMHNSENSLIDFNRAGTPLAEIVTYPDIKSPEQAKKFLQNLRQICKYLNVSDADMEKGNLRCDVNISMRPKGSKKLFPKTEIKNLNSFRSVERALKYEKERQTKLWENNNYPKEQVTMGWDENKQITILQRTKEDSNDYRYFKEPDLNPLVIDKKYIKKIKSELIELPSQKTKRFIKEYNLDYYNAEVLTSSKEIANYFEEVVVNFKAYIDNKKSKLSWKKNRKNISQLIASWIGSELFKLLNESSLDIYNTKISAEYFAELMKMIYEQKINSTIAQKILKEMFETGISPELYLQNNDFSQVNDEKELEQIVLKIISDNSDQVVQYKNGKENLMKYFIGVAMKETRGKANPVIVEKIFKDKLK